MKTPTQCLMANLYLDAALQLGLQYRIENKEKGIACIYNKNRELRIRSHNLSLNVKESVYQSIHKETTSSVLRLNGFPVPDFAVFDSAQKAILYAIAQVKNNISIVVKPSDSSGGKGINIHPKTEFQIKNAVSEAFKFSEKIIVEEFISGRHYRITILDDEIIAITQRIPAYVTADGNHTVEKLIDMKNILRVKNQYSPIILREKDYDFLKRTGITMKTIYEKGHEIRLQLGCNYYCGERVRINKNSIPHENKDLFIRSIQALGLRYGGVDFISPDITVPYTELRSAINEINSSPHQDLHYSDSDPKDNYAAKRIIEKLFESPISQKRADSHNILVEV